MGEEEFGRVRWEWGLMRGFILKSVFVDERGS